MTDQIKRRNAYAGDRVTVIGRYWRGHGREWEGEVRGWSGISWAEDEESRFGQPTGYWVQCGEGEHKVHQVTARQVVSIRPQNTEGVTGR